MSVHIPISTQRKYFTHQWLFVFNYFKNENCKYVDLSFLIKTKNILSMPVFEESKV